MLRRPDGTFNRDLNEFLDRKVPANANPIAGIYSFDVIIDRSTGLLNRVYMPAHNNGPTGPNYKLLPDLDQPLSPTGPVPVIIFFHGGSFVHSSANSAIYDTFCRRLAATCRAAVVSVNYRRSPEHRFPAAYEDGWAALKWAHSRPWLASGSCEGGRRKVHAYLAGDSSGGNIAHHVAARAAEENVEVLGSILLHPLFGGEERTESEKMLDGKYFVKIEDRDWYWRAYLPEGEDRDHPACNVFGPRAQPIKSLGFPKSLVVVAGLDLLQDWQLGYVDGLRKNGVEVRLLFLEKATIGFYFLPNNEHFCCLMDEMNEFLHS
ncbi:alpha/beta-Hydrolases superfamily protein [Striga asiatica]|uniref:Alpha/beta-Hydrolases superfamily protein n=1 Tax=Striga asiatica TaxID=4170 RepID=A0A5A7NWZ2_STRAF|nr:alpha/beta-Hydrolases superfamily protein [Striga asiatica]